jgi:membrane protein DedA with SNARE-associated domain
MGAALPRRGHILVEMGSEISETGEGVTAKAALKGSWGWLARLPTPLVLVGGVVLILLVGTGIGLVPILLGVSEKDLEALGYPGVFLANFLATATLFVPVPGLTAAGQALLVALARTLNPALVALVGGLGMALAELTAYAAGRGLRELSSQRPMPMRGRLGRALSRAAALIDRLMLHYGMPTLFVLSAVPNPLFEFAGITAGAVRMPLWRFLCSVSAGKLLRAFLLAYVGQRFLDLF